MRFSLRMSFDEVITTDEEKILENIRYCSRLIGTTTFKVILWNQDISEKETEAFIKRNEKLLFEVNTQITKKSTGDYSWFLIDGGVGDKCRSTYKFQGTILTGIVSYIRVVKQFQRIEKDENSNSR